MTLSGVEWVRAPSLLAVSLSNPPRGCALPPVFTRPFRSARTDLVTEVTEREPESTEEDLGSGSGNWKQDFNREWREGTRMGARKGQKGF
jgi:hypothetical protein